MDNRNRLYSEIDIERLKQIQRLTQDLRINLAGVEVIFNLLDQMEQMRTEMESEIEQLRKELEQQKQPRG
jgi:MerR family transcriptional regulator/heat shock protein HspR